MAIRILILEDDDRWGEEFSEILAEEGHKTERAINLTQARKLLMDGRFHVAVLDIILEGKSVEIEGQENGLDLLHDISKLNQDFARYCGYVIVTGNAKMENAVAAFQENPISNLKKEPIVLKRGEDGGGFQPDELLETVRTVLQRVLIERARLYDREKYNLFFDFAPAEKTRIELVRSGATIFADQSSNAFNIDIDAFSDRADDLQFRFSATDQDERERWRPRSKRIGVDLHGELLNNDVKLSEKIAFAKARENMTPLHLIFRGPHDLIRLPLELFSRDIIQ